MKVFVPTNNKGGVGKTRIAAIFAEYASKVLGKKTLAIDFDPQCNLSQLYLKMEIDPSSPEGFVPPYHPDYDPTDEEDTSNGKSSIADIFYKELETQGVVPYPTYIENLDIAPAHASRLLNAEAVRRSEVMEKIHNRLLQFLSHPELASLYDLVVIDTAPSKGPLTVSAIKAASHMMIPTLMEDKPIQGVYGMMQLWMQESYRRTKEKPLELIGILANMYNGRTALHQNLYESLAQDESMSKYLMPMTVGKRIVFAEADASNAEPKSIFDLPDSNLAKQESLAFCKYIAERIF